MLREIVFMYIINFEFSCGKELEMCSGQFFLPILVWLIFWLLLLGGVRPAFFGLEKFASKKSNFSIFFLSGKKNLLRLGQKIPWSEPVKPLDHYGSENAWYAWGRSRPISKKNPLPILLGNKCCFGRLENEDSMNRAGCVWKRASPLQYGANKQFWVVSLEN